MFKRRRAASSPAQPPPPSASASLAASKAFLQDRHSNAALSSAAAAAALRTHPHAPTQVGDTVTKRMVRKNSVSSQSSSQQGIRPGSGLGLRRHSSSGSMTERSFRAPSPTKNHSPVPPDDAPPVPAVPKNIPSTPVVHRRASSLEPRRGTSPAVKTGRGRGASVDTGSRAAPVSASQRVASLPQLTEHDAEGRPRSVNFSRPISPPTTATASPTKPARAGHSGWFAAPVVDATQTFRGGPPGRPKTSDGGARQYEAQQTWYSIQNAADARVATKRGKMGQGVEGARLNAGSMRVKPSGSAVGTGRPSAPVDPKSPDAVYDPSTRTFIRKQEAMAKHREIHEEMVEEPLYTHAPPQHSHPPPRYEHVPVPEHQQPRGPPQPRHTKPSPVRFQPIQDRERHPTPPRQPVLEPSPITFQVNKQPSMAQALEHAAHHPSPAHFTDVREVYPQEEGGGANTTSTTLARMTSEDRAGTDVRPVSVEHVANSLRVETTPSPRVGASAPGVQASSSRIEPYQYTRSASPRLSTPVSPASDTPVGRGRGSIRTDRGSSLSPPRNAHFATLEIPNGVRHQPPPRSVSPAKSALKHSPSTSKERRSSGPASVSDSSELMVEYLPQTADAGAETARKRSANRVSFDEHPVIRVAYDTGETYKEKEKASSPTGLRWSSNEHENDALDDLMKPRAALPSFGSIRAINRRHDDGDDDTPENEKVTETVSSLSASVGSIGRPLRPREAEGEREGVSSDAALAGIVGQGLAHTQAPHSSEPLPPEVTSVEGTGYVSDSDSNHSEMKTPYEEAGDKYQLEPKTLTTPGGVDPTAIDVPVIALQPATPTPNLHSSWEEELEPEYPYIQASDAEKKAQPIPVIPGGWADNDSGSKRPTDSTSTNTETDIRPAPGPAPSISFGETPVPQRTFPDDSSSDGDSIYSDAYEELTDAEEGTFASIDQIVESPVSKSAPGLTQARFAHDGSEVVTGTGLGVTPADGWDAARGHWNGIVDTASQKKEPKETAPAVPQIEHSQTQLQPKMTQRTSTRSSGSGPTDHSYGYSEPVTIPATSAAAPSTPRPVQPQQQQQLQLRKSALKKAAAPSSPQHASPATATHIRKSMRGSGSASTASQTAGLAVRERQVERETGMRRTMRERSGGAAPVPAQAKGTLQKQSIPARKAASNSLASRAAAAAPTPTPAPAYDSDSAASVSSFQRERQRRRGSSSAGGRVSMRRSMRSGSDAPTMRPASTMRPTPTMRPISPPSQTGAGFRKSMRSPSPAVVVGGAEREGPRSSRFSIRSLSPAGRLISSKKVAKGGKSKPSTPAGKPAKVFSSRFDDSSGDDFESGTRPRFQSRFADSDSDSNDGDGGYALPQGLAPVRGIPRRPGEQDGDSTDLEDENSDDEAVVPVAGSPHVGTIEGEFKSKNAPAPELPAMQAGEKSKTKTKRGFFGLGKKKKKEEAIAVAEDGPETLKTPDHSVPMPPPHTEREQGTGSSTETETQVNRPLTPIGEDQDLEASPPQRTRSPKLQRRLTPQWTRTTSDSWPLPSTPLDTASTQGDQPRAAGTAPATAKTAIDPKTGKEIIVGRSGKKKKFQGLRRVFGLND